MWILSERLACSNILQDWNFTLATTVVAFTWSWCSEKYLTWTLPSVAVCPICLGSVALEINPGVYLSFQFWECIWKPQSRCALHVKTSVRMYQTFLLPCTSYTMCGHKAGPPNNTHGQFNHNPGNLLQASFVNIIHPVIHLISKTNTWHCFAIHPYSQGLYKDTSNVHMSITKCDWG